MQPLGDNVSGKQCHLSSVFDVCIHKTQHPCSRSSAWLCLATELSLPLQPNHSAVPFLPCVVSPSVDRRALSMRYPSTISWWTPVASGLLPRTACACLVKALHQHFRTKHRHPTTLPPFKVVVGWACPFHACRNQIHPGWPGEPDMLRSPS